MASPLVSRSEAAAKRTHHQFVPGIGYLAHSGPPELPGWMSGSKNCDPPAGTAEGSVHLLRPPSGGTSMEFLWVAAEKAWAPANGRGNRLAWPTSHLMRAGWEYDRPGRESRVPEPVRKKAQARK